MSGKILYVYASVCIKERIYLYRVALHIEVMQCGVAPIRKLRANRSSPQYQSRASSRQFIVQGLEQLSVLPVLDVSNEQRGSVFVLLVVDLDQTYVSPLLIEG